MRNLLLLDNFDPAISILHRQVQKERRRRIIAYGSVTRYGPQSVASASDQSTILRLVVQGVKINSAWQIL